MEDVKTRKLKEMADKLQLKEKQNQVCRSSRLCRIFFLVANLQGRWGGESQGEKLNKSAL
jgi:hypothetical protein